MRDAMGRSGTLGDVSTLCVRVVLSGEVLNATAEGTLVTLARTMATSVAST